MYVRTVGDSSAVFSWQEALMVWQKFGIFLLLFLLHDIFLAPLLVYQHRRLLYGTLVVVIVAAFTACFQKMLGFSIAKTAWRSLLAIVLYYIILGALLLGVFLILIFFVFFVVKRQQG
jgi:hypothetical protein